MKTIAFGICSLLALAASSQELYVFSEPASNTPAHSLGIRLSANFTSPQVWHNRPMQRYISELQLGISKKWMIHGGAGFGDMHTNNFAWESIFLNALKGKK